MNSSEYFYIYDAEITSYRGGLRQAKLSNPLPWQLMQKWTVESAFEPLEEEIPLFKFRVWDKVKHPDNYFNANNVNLYSEKLIELLIVSGISKYEIFDAEVRENKSNNLIDDKYSVFRLMEEFSLINREKSTFLKDNIIFDKVVLNENLKDAPPLFRDKSFVNLFFISNKMKKILEENEVTGFRFRTIDEYVDSMRKNLRN